jgi:hypothetical protein
MVGGYHSASGRAPVVRAHCRHRRAAPRDGVCDRQRRQAGARTLHSDRRRLPELGSGWQPLQISGPTGAFIVILAGITAKYGIAGLQIATLMAGVMLILMGMARLGSVIKYIPDPVIVGFTTGIGVIIWVG